MKQQDIAIIIVIVFIASILSFFASNKFIAPAEKRTAETVSRVTSEFNLPDNKVFNDTAINPTVKIEISPSDNGQPFENKQQ